MGEAFQLLLWISGSISLVCAIGNHLAFEEKRKWLLTYFLISLSGISYLSLTLNFFWGPIKTILSIVLFFNILVSGTIWFRFFIKNKLDKRIKFLTALFCVACILSLATRTGLLVFGLWTPIFYWISQRTHLDVHLIGDKEIATVNISEIQTYITKIDDLLKKDDLLCDPQLRIQNIAQKTGLTKQKVSEIINKTYQCNFNVYINRLRVQKSTTLMKEHPNLKLEAISKKSGFNSYNSFRTAFTQELGETPSTYRQKLGA